MSPVNSARLSPIKDVNLKVCFSGPPAPPPQQPLPEKPDAATSLKRLDTERLKTGSPVRSEVQLSSLNEALTSAKKEIESQGIRLRDLDSLLNEERRAREEAEERASRLERESSKEQEETDSSTNEVADVPGDGTADESNDTASLKSEPTSPIDTENSTNRLQQRLDLMLIEMSEMKQQMECYRERAEAAEADRTTLAEMIESIRNDNARLASKEVRQRRRSRSQRAQAHTQISIEGTEEDEVEEGEITIIREKEIDEDGTDMSLSGTTLQNGDPVEHNGTMHVSKPFNGCVTQHSKRDLMYHGGPVGAIVTVVAIGVAVMAMLNQYSKADR